MKQALIGPLKAHQHYLIPKKFPPLLKMVNEMFLKSRENIKKSVIPTKNFKPNASVESLTFNQILKLNFKLSLINKK